MLSDVLEFTSNATHMQQVCNKYIDMYRTFSEESANGTDETVSSFV